MRMSASSGKSTTRRRLICSGLQAVAHRRSARWGLFKPFQIVDGPAATVPSGRCNCPLSRVWTYSCSRGFARELRRLGPPSGGLRLPLRDRRSVVRLTATGRGVPSQLTRDRAGIALELTTDRPDPETLRLQHSEVLTLVEGQVAAGGLGQDQRRHAASVAKPPRRDWRGHADLECGVLRAPSLRDQE